ncbi:MAG: DUF61 family protein [Methanomassiliicoccales archaeon]|nr:DUF61 family protein [Methanomassiliicoccales archaeon]
MEDDISSVQERPEDRVASNGGRVLLENGTFQKLIMVMNKHVPSTRKTLRDLMSQNEPAYVGKDGNTYRVSKDELEIIASQIEDYERGGIKIPILIMTDTSYPGGAWKVMGRIETKVVSRIIGREPDTPEEIRLFHPHFVDLRKRLPSSTTVLYMP